MSSEPPANETPGTTPVSTGEVPHPEAPRPGSRAVGAGRGLIYITAAKIWFMVGGAALGFILPHLFKSKITFGEWGVVLSAVSWPNNVIVTATIQAVSKFASRGPDYVEGTKRAALRLHLFFGVGVALAYCLLAPLIADYFWHDTHLVAPLRISAAVVLCYSFYAVFVGAANGAREFHKQAGLDATFTTLRAIFVCAAAVAIGTAAGAMTGFVAAAAAVLGISVWAVGLGQTRERTTAGEVWRFMAPVSLYLLILNALMFLDGWVIKALVEQSAAAAGRAQPAEVASEAAALYTAAQSVARIPYQAILSVTFVIFPLVSQATFQADAARTRGYIDKAIRLSLLLVTMMAATVAARPDAPLNFFPRGEYLPAGPALAALAFGYVAYSILAIAGTIINGSGRTKPTTVIGVATLAADAALTYGAVRWALATGRDPLMWAAAASTAAMGLGAALSLGYLHRTFGASLRLSTALRCALGAAATIAVGRVLPLHGRLGALVAAAVAAAVYVVVLFVSRELTPRELRALVRR